MGRAMAIRRIRFAFQKLGIEPDLGNRIKVLFNVEWCLTLHFGEW